ncbi:MAG: Gfo/Idh/MocA family oxidoreductase [Candidatus Hydrothermae bacterium]|nr:Gfo/Idh/MocA family oxidoreductase [Candidatus Hydrothermae bacterium]
MFGVGSLGQGLRFGGVFDDAKAMADAVDRAGVAAVFGYNYTQNPTFLHAIELLQSGVIGRPIHFRGIVDEDYQADPKTPWTWRSLQAEAGLGVLGDLTCHLISMALRLMGPITVIGADMQTVHRTRPLEDGSGTAKVENEDIASALLRFENGAQGVISSSRVAWGRKNRSALVRVPAFKKGKGRSCRVEYRAPDPGTNPYFAFAAMLTAGLVGIEKGYDLPEPVEEDIYAMPEEVKERYGIDALPASLDEAIRVMAESEVARLALGDEVFEKFLKNKRAEWDRYRMQVTDFELREYLPRL